MHGIDEKCIQNSLLVGESVGKIPLEEIGVDGRITLKYILKK
jgi:hypothetical protein